MLRIVSHVLQGHIVGWAPSSQLSVPTGRTILKQERGQVQVVSRAHQVPIVWLAHPAPSHVVRELIPAFLVP